MMLSEEYLWKHVAFAGVFSIISKYFASKTDLIPFAEPITLIYRRK